MEVLLTMVVMVIAVSLLASAVTGLLALAMLAIAIWPFLACLFDADNALLSASYIAAAVWISAGLVLQCLWLSVRERTKLPRREERREHENLLREMPVGRDAAIDWYILKMSNLDTGKVLEHSSLLHSESEKHKT